MIPPFLRYQLFVLLGACLLFGLEPMVGKLLLPSAGGSFQVWATSLMFFQGALFAGYVYTHFLAGRLGRWHLALLAAALPFLPIGSGLAEVRAEGSPVQAVLLALLTSIGLPFFLLSTSGVIAQRWLARSDLPQRDNPYPLFAVSNAGSLLALVAYPLLAEPLLGLERQRWIWSGVFLVYVALAASLAPARRAKEAAADDAAAPPPEGGDGADGGDDAAEPPTRGQLLTWCLLSAAPSAFLMAVTNLVAADLGSFPLVWVPPLAAYLITFMLAFGRRHRYPDLLRRAWPALVALGVLYWATSYGAMTWVGFAVQLGLLFVVALVGHGELFRARPAPRYLTDFYVAVSLGGWLGGMFVALLAPLLFDDVTEWPLSIAALALTLAASRRRDLAAWVRGAPRWELALSALVVLGSAGWIVQDRLGRQRESLLFRNYYGIYRVADLVEEDPAGEEKVVRYLVHGTTTHGWELRTDLGRPVGVFHPEAPLGEVLRARRRPADVAVIGLGAGMLAAYMGPGESVTFYEIDPLVFHLAKGHFTFLWDPETEALRTDVDVVIGDARLTLQDAPDAAFDVLIVDAFSGGSVPSHLITREALALYRRKLSPRGLMVFHVSSRYFDLRPVLQSTGAALEPPMAGAWRAEVYARSLAEDQAPSVVFALADDPAALAPLLEGGWSRAAADDPPRPWTDDYSNPLAPLWARWEED